MSTRWTSTRQRSTWARNSCPSPAPFAAPSIRPGMSARTSWRSSESSVPSTGSTVVNGYSATFGAARVSRRRSDDFPAFGWPTRPASASSLRRSSIQPDSPSSPRSAKRGAWRVELAKRLLPWPPSPPDATTARWPGSTQVVAAPSSASTWVPGGTGISLSSPRAPCCCFPRPCPPRSARKCRARCSEARSRRDGSQTSTTSPPRPPSPPSGPPRGTWASRRKLTQPSPPRPPST